MEAWYNFRNQAAEKGALAGTEPITAVVYFTLGQLEKQCTNIVQANQVKTTNYAFCNNIFTTQDFSAPNTYRDKPERKPYKKITNYKPVGHKKTYRVQKSTTASKPHLDKNRHVRVYNPERNYKSTIGCFICNDPKHFARDCPKKTNSNSREALAVECCNLNLIRTDKDILSEESIWSIRSIELEILDIREDDTIEEPLDLNYFSQNIENVLTEQCIHKWKHKGTLTIACSFCKMYPGLKERAHCLKCFEEGCIDCINKHFQLDLDFSEKLGLTTEQRIKLDITDRALKNFGDEFFLLTQAYKELETRIEKVENRINNLEGDALVHKILKPDKQKGILIEDNVENTFQEVDVLRICNKGPEIFGVRVSALAIFSKHQVKCTPMIDSGCITVFINERIIPKDEPIIIDEANSFDSYTSTQQKVRTNRRLKNPLKLKFITQCGEYSQSYNCPFGPKYVWVRPDLGEDFLLGTSFIYQGLGGLMLAQNFVIFFRQSTLSPILGNKIPPSHTFPLDILEYASKKHGGYPTPLGNNVQPANLTEIVKDFPQNCKCKIPGNMMPKHRHKSSIL